MEGVQTYGGVQMYWGIRTSPKYWAIQTYGGIQPYEGHPNIEGASKHMGEFNQMGCPNIQGISKHMQGVSKHIEDIQTCGRCLNIQGASKCEGVQTCRDIQT